MYLVAHSQSSDRWQHDNYHTHSEKAQIR